MTHISKLTKILISTKQLDDKGYTYFYDDNSWKITNSSLVVAKGTKSGTLYMLHGTTDKDHIVYVTK